MAFQDMRIQSTSSTKIEMMWSVPADLPYLNGHFPGYPVLPAVGIVDGSVEGLRKALGYSQLHLREILLAKFLRPVRPDQSVRLVFSKKGEDIWRAEWLEEESKAPAALIELRVASQ